MGSLSRPLAEYGPDIWGDKFTSNHRDFELWKAYSEERDELKNEARSMLLSDGEKWIEKLILINTIERLGVGYHFAEYIEDMLDKMHNAHASTNENYDLFNTALYFRILRQHGYNVSSEIFNKYKDIDGNFREAITRDPEGLLSLYEAAHLRTHGEAVLDEALVFTTSHLTSIAKSLDSGSLAKQARRALEQPEGNRFISENTPHFNSRIKLESVKSFRICPRYGLRRTSHHGDGDELRLLVYWLYQEGHQPSHHQYEG